MSEMDNATFIEEIMGIKLFPYQKEIINKMNENIIKQVIVMRKDLNMRKGKIAAQASHASVAAIIKTSLKDKDCFPFELNEDDMLTMGGYSYLAQWTRDSFRKICVYVNSEEELLNIYNQGVEKDYIVSLVRDSGLTEFHGVPTFTCLAFEPLPNKLIDEITGKLPLY
jgi:PTH2 family peptidyl-tRNA hydrolase